MNIAHIIPSSVTYPLSAPNGRYDWVRQLALQQVKQGHTVTIYGNAHSKVEGVLFSGIEMLSDDKRQNNLDTFALALSSTHDVYHSHFDNLHYVATKSTDKPIIYTQHWWPSSETIELANSAVKSNVWAVPPTKYMYDFDIVSGIQTKGYIHHGINLEFFKKTSNEKNGRLLFVGRISPEKNLEIAISTARKAGIGLDIVGKITQKNHHYWQSLQHLIDGQLIRYIGSKKQSELVDLYSEALGVICPYEATEAFGLVSIESQACGTPIILKAGGSRSELLIEGKTGFLCETEDEFVKAISKLSSLNAVDCETFAQKFSIEQMAKKYEDLYAQIN